ncbi:hypothetical protein F7725_015289 [Dissostichus mawsoni]|uniref:Uncharacterized protein n=1 Tax=Dissostichus mawsoni TaxID=36200 RepID=A0A7J5YH17_DISMA|nr:hypothetical protein F7725_015289 [Dissostichus mawsoni]
METRGACSDQNPAMSHKYQGDASGEAGEEQKGPPRSRQPNGTSPGEAPVRRSWRPCQINQDGEPNPHHHHHHHQPPHHQHQPSARGAPRHRRQPPSGQSQAHSPGLVPSLVSTSPNGEDNRDFEPRPVQQARPAVTRYRRHGDPNPRLRGQRQKQPIRDMQDSPPGVEERQSPAEVQVEQRSLEDPVSINQLQDRGSPHQTPIAVVPPTQLSPAPATHDMQPRLPDTPPAEAEEDLQEPTVECEEKPEEIQAQDEEQEQAEDDGDISSTPSHSHCSHEDTQAVDEGVEERSEEVEEDQVEEMDDVPEDIAAQGSEITDLCSDTESVASLSLDGPLHSPPPLQSPTPPSSPDVPPFPQIDHFSEDASMSPVPDNDLLPEDEDDDCSDSGSPPQFSSYPKTYADFYTESHQKTYQEPVYESYPETKSFPNSFPEPLKTSYPELHREPRRQSGWRTESKEAQQETPFNSHRQENVQKGAPSSPTKSSHYAQRQGRASHHPPLDRSVGCRLHHYDGQSDVEGEGADQSPLPKSRRKTPRQAESQAKSPSSGQSSSGETQEERNAVGVGLQGEEGTRGSGDAITLAIKDIKEAIEEVKTKVLRSPYTPDRPVEPIWVMRQEVSPTEEGYPLQTAAGHSSPHSPAQSLSESPSRFVPVREPVSPPRAESSRLLLLLNSTTNCPPNNTTTTKPTSHSRGTPPGRRRHTHSLNRTNTRRPISFTIGNISTNNRLHINRSFQLSGRDLKFSHSRLYSSRRSRSCADLFLHFQRLWMSRGHVTQTTLLTASSSQRPTWLHPPAVGEDAHEERPHAAGTGGHEQSAGCSEAGEEQKKDAEAPSTAEVDLFMSTQRIKVLNADTQESLMDLPLRTISYIADIGNMVVLMARGKMVRSRSAQENLDQAAEQTTMSPDDRRLYRMICHVFESEDAQLIAQSIGQSFSVAYQEFLRANGIDPEDLSQREYSDLLNTQDMYNDDLIHFSKSENCRDVYIEKQKGEMLGVVIVESGWGSILPTVIIASMMHTGPAEKSSRLNIGDQIMTINGTSLVGLPLSTCQSIIKGLKSQSRIKLNIVRCPPVTMVLIRRPDLRYQLGFSVQNGIICSLMRGGIAERGGVRVGHRIIEINSQSVVATPHEKIVQILSNAMGEIHMKTMPAAMYRLLTAQEQPVYI